MTTNQLIRELSGVSWKLGTEDLPVKVNDIEVDILEITLKEEGDTRYCNIKIKRK